MYVAKECAPRHTYIFFSFLPFSLDDYSPIVFGIFFSFSFLFFFIFESFRFSSFQLVVFWEVMIPLRGTEVMMGLQQQLHVVV